MGAAPNAEANEGLDSNGTSKARKTKKGKKKKGSRVVCGPFTQQDMELFASFPLHVLCNVSVAFYFRLVNNSAIFRSLRSFFQQMCLAW